MRKAIGAVIIKDDEILLFRENLTWKLPGGKPEKGESYIEALVREIKEEASGAKIEVINYFGNYIGKTPHKGDILEAIVYSAKLKHPGLKIIPSGEIREAKFVNYTDALELNLSNITREIIKDLIGRRY